MERQQQKNKGQGSQNSGYKKVNSYTQSPSFEQILTIVLFVIVLALYSVFIPSAITQQDSSILWIMLVVTYLFFVMVFVDYCRLTCEDPVDDLVLGVKKTYGCEQLKLCKYCKLYVHKSSYHCHSCDRCVEYFDHHCKYLNNCIGGKNYVTFIRLLVVVTIFCVLIIGQGIWIFVLAHEDGAYEAKIVSKWGVLASIIFTFIMMFTVDTLLCFHFYLLFYLKKSTLHYIMSLEQSQTSKERIADPQ